MARNKPDSSIIYTKSLKIPERTYSGDNLHPDRYLPNMKMFYYPFSVDKTLLHLCMLWVLIK